MFSLAIIALANCKNFFLEIVQISEGMKIHSTPELNPIQEYFVP
jgi:hypothetical protein